MKNQKLDKVEVVAKVVRRDAGGIYIRRATLADLRAER